MDDLVDISLLLNISSENISFAKTFIAKNVNDGILNDYICNSSWHEVVAEPGSIPYEGFPKEGTCRYYR